MIDERELREMLERRAGSVSATPMDTPKAVRRARRRLVLNAGVGMVAAAVIAVATFAGVDAIRSTPIPADRPTPAPAPDVLDANREVLVFTGEPGLFERAPGDLVVVNPETGEERLLVEDLEAVYSATWSADGRWVAFEDDAGLWTVAPGQELRPVTADSQGPWSWSPTGARLAFLEGSRLSVLDVGSETTTELGRVSGDAISSLVWSPDGTRLVYGARGGTLSSVDVDSGDRSILVQLPGEDLDSVDGIDWSPDGTRLAINADIVPGISRLYLVNADGSDIRVLRDEIDGGGTAWSPDGGRLAYLEHGGPGMRIWLQTLDRVAPILVGGVPVRSCASGGCGGLVWSPDGSRLALEGGYSNGGFEYFAIDADGQGEPESIDELTYRSWVGGWYP